jgi:hypothetical protein
MHRPEEVMPRILLSLTLAALFAALPGFFPPTLAHTALASPAPAEQPPDPFHEHPDALPVPQEGIAAIAAESGLFYHPSAFMAGSVAVQVLLPESSGESGLNSETWAPAQIQSVEASVAAALAWWQARVPAAQLSFTTELKVVPSAYEPIAYGVGDEGLWIGDLLRRMGHTQQSYFGQAFAAADALRQAKGSDWALTIFVVNSANDSDGRFADRRFAYAYVGGPFLVLTSDGGAYGASNLAPVIAHEIGHLFGALDQYAAAQMGCELRGGYLAVPNRNSRSGSCGGTLPSIMFDPLSAYALGAVDPFALGQIGYRDGDSDGLIDVLDTAPMLTLDAATGAGGQPLISGHAQDQPFPTNGGLGISVNRVERFEYTLGDAQWRTAALDQPLADDGRFALSLPLFDGRYTLGLRAINSVGAASAILTRSLEVRGVGPAPTFSATAPAFVGDAVLPLTLGGPAVAFQASSSPLFTDAPWRGMASQVSLALPDDQEAAYTIFVRFQLASGARSEVFTLRSVLDRTPPTGQVQQLRDGAITLAASDQGSGVVEMLIDAEPQLAAAAWQPYQARLDLPRGTAIQGVRFRDRAGNISPLYQPNAGITIGLPVVVR